MTRRRHPRFMPFGGLGGRKVGRVLRASVPGRIPTPGLGGIRQYTARRRRKVTLRRLLG